MEDLSDKIAKYLFENFSSKYNHLDFDLDVISSGNDNYIAEFSALHFCQDNSTYEISLVLAFDDVQYEELDESSGTSWYSAIINIKSCSVSNANLINSDDLFEFYLDIDSLYKFMYKIQPLLATESIERTDFYIKCGW